MQDRHSVWDVGAVSGCTRKHAHFLPVLDPFLINSDTLSTLRYCEPANLMHKRHLMHPLRGFAVLQCAERVGVDQERVQYRIGPSFDQLRHAQHTALQLRTKYIVVR